MTNDVPPVDPENVIPYDPNQMVRVSSRTGPVAVEATDDGTTVRIGPTESGEGGDPERPPAPPPHESTVETCQETLRQGMYWLFNNAGDDEITFDDFQHIVSDAQSAARVPVAGPVPDAPVVPSEPLEAEGQPTDGFGSLNAQADALREQLVEVLSHLDVQVDYRKDEAGNHVRLRTNVDLEEGAPTDAADRPAGNEDEHGEEGTAPPLPLQHEVKRSVDGGMVTISYHTPSAATPTANGDTGAGIANNTVGYINKRVAALIANDFANLQAVFNVGFNINLNLGFEED